MEGDYRSVIDCCCRVQWPLESLFELFYCYLVYRLMEMNEIQIKVFKSTLMTFRWKFLLRSRMNYSKNAVFYQFNMHTYPKLFNSPFDWPRIPIKGYLIYLNRKLSTIFTQLIIKVLFNCLGMLPISQITRHNYNNDNSQNDFITIISTQILLNKQKS